MARTYFSSHTIEDSILSLSGNKVLLLDCPLTAWLVQEGKADVYAVRIERGLPQGRLMHLFRAEMGQTLFGVNKNGFGQSASKDTKREVAASSEMIRDGRGLVVTGTPGTTLVRRKREDLLKRAREKKNTMLAEPAVYLVESWVLSLFHGIITQVPPTRFIPLNPGDAVTMAPGNAFRPKDDILWVRHREGASKIAGREELTLWAGSTYHPLTGDSWAQAIEEGQIECSSTLDLVDLSLSDATMDLWKALDYFHQNALNCISQNEVYLKSHEKERLIKGAKDDQIYLQRAFQYLERAVKLEEDIEERASDPLVEVCRQVGRVINISIKEPPQWVKVNRGNDVDYIRDIAQASNIRYRRISLKDDWWKEDMGPLVAFKEEDGSPVAILPGQRGSYKVYDPVTGQEELLGSHHSKTLSSAAYMLYPSFSEDALSLKSLAKYAYGAIWKKDLVLALFMGALGGLLGLILPFLTGILFDEIIPAADTSQLVFLLQFLLVSSFSLFFFQVVRSIALLRITTRIDATVQAAIWDRLLKLPLSFFHRYSAGELGNRAMSLNIVLNLVSGMVSNTFFNGLFSIVNFVLIFYYSSSLALVALLLVFFAMLFTMSVGMKQYRLQQDVYKIEGAIAGLLLQVFGGISRFRMAGAESRAYFLWAREFGQQRQLSYKSQVYGNILTTFSIIYPLLASIVIFFSLYVFYGGAGEGFSTGIFLAFNAAFTGMLASLMALSSQMVTIITALPLLNRFRPILEAKPEVDEQRIDPGELRGDIEISRVSFRYYADDPLVLDDVSIKIKAGAMVAIVGSSGSGKSTLLKILLGFLEPEKGTIYYDGQDLSSLDLRYVRSQLGIVLQNDRLSPGPIMETILGASGLTIDDAWEAARMAGVEEAIKAMPMGMHTFISEGASTISGGQRQRLLIARAIVKKPRIIMFDEATSALDNRTQKVVKESLDSLKSTRLVIAHRLSTVKNADMIVVLDKGRVAQSGSFDELMQEQGIFREMASRQLV